jgi:hypothetical protein
VDISIRSCLTAGVATVTAAAIAFAPSIEPARPPTAAASQVVHFSAQAMTLTAGASPLAAASVTDILSLIEHYVVPPSAGKPFPTPHFPPAVAPTSIGNSIIGIYNAVEPWARWVADVAAYAVGWVPYVGWLSGQIPIFYNFGERIARSITYNIAYWLDGKISFGQGLINVGYDTVNAFIQLGIDQWNFWLWPLPPLPPIFPGALAATTAELTTAAVTEDPTAAGDAPVDAPKLKKKDRDAADAASLASAVTAAEATEARRGSGIDTVKKPKEPKSPKVATGVAAQDDESTASNDAPKKGPHSEKKADKGSTEKAATNSSSSPTKSDDGAKRDKKDRAGKKE